jgi:predicted nucleotidyltransferase component of viral defense system
MITKKELEEIARIKGLTLGNAEKDYLIDIALLSISKNTKNELVFKGGTALKKCYFGDYRFSEDLDYTLIEDTSTDPEAIRQYLTEVFGTLYEHFGLKISSHNILINPFLDKR